MPLAAIATKNTRFDRRLAELLAHAAEVFCAKGYEGASMRDLARASGISLAGLYHYCDSKEELLYLIQRHAFTTIVARLRVRLANVTGPEARLRVFILNHLEYFLAEQPAMKVLSHEAEVLTDARGAAVAALKRDYYKIAKSLVDDLKRAHALQLDSRIAVLSLFGMMNWIYTWHHPRTDADAAQLAQQMGDIFLGGMQNSKNGKTSLGTKFSQNSKSAHDSRAKLKLVVSKKIAPRQPRKV